MSQVVCLLIILSKNRQSILLASLGLSCYEAQEGFNRNLQSLTSLNLGETSHGQPGTRPPSCTTPQQPTIYSPVSPIFHTEATVNINI